MSKLYWPRSIGFWWALWQAECALTANGISGGSTKDLATYLRSDKSLTPYMRRCLAETLERVPDRNLRGSRGEGKETEAPKAKARRVRARKRKWLRDNPDHKQVPTNVTRGFIKDEAGGDPTVAAKIADYLNKHPERL
jgi:hypothetical protein